MDNKIVLIENADPGYDFIFSHKILGLVTKFGGMNFIWLLDVLKIIYKLR